ncbi:hypothetical protein PCASD_26075 [Puccinia coronata f. sp. avenae]|uniref:Uncharacterized protein n=1 Tax=Puccinia coronata f. sp. avenae TaxID=200324 RepID=A0A2N5RW14_9BASI|nr:hypothetical protein PCASD_26075 [Puccinia coronata f. sp. avenae]
MCKYLLARRELLAQASVYLPAGSSQRAGVYLLAESSQRAGVYLLAESSQRAGVYLLSKTSQRAGVYLLAESCQHAGGYLLAESLQQAGTARKSGSDGCIRVFIGCGHPIQTRARATDDSLGGARPSLNRMAASDNNSDAAIRANFSGSESSQRAGVYLLAESLQRAGVYLLAKSLQRQVHSCLLGLKK